MRYFFAIAGAIVFAALVARFIGVPIADWVVARQSFNSPIAADDMHGWIYLAALLGGLMIGWSFGWALGGRFEREDAEL